MNILFINACVRKESRTLVLAKDILSKMQGEITEIDLTKENLTPLNRVSLEERERLLKSGETDAPMLQYAKQFAQADEIVIAAPFWDLSFPSILKIYMEQITVAGITFEYRNGVPTGLCKAKRLVYITTAGGEIFCDFGYAYIKAIATNFFGIQDTVSHRATNLDVQGISADELLQQATFSTVK
ncbi:MAG: ACP phosphodiesterase [Clostridiales bacterium]|nr:ACP phosphodiesterase [Clostridiales bacterium]